nr:short-chain fatty acyl-CoA regulator family protein [Hoeflea marina]
MVRSWRRLAIPSLPDSPLLCRRRPEISGVEAGGDGPDAGPACRLCERSGCLARAEPPITRPLGLDEMVTGLSAFDFQ